MRNVICKRVQPFGHRCYLGSYRPISSKSSCGQHRRRFFTDIRAQDFNDLLSKVQDKARDLREAAVTRTLRWPSAPSITSLPGLNFIPDIKEGGTIATAVKEQSLGFGFSAGGMLFPYYIGVLEGLQGVGLATENTPIGGSSAGSILAVSHHGGLGTDVLAAACLELAADCRDNGTRGRLGSVLEKFLHKLLPKDIHERCRNKAFVAVTKAFPTPQGVLVTDFRSREDLIQAVMTSCHIPWWFDNSLATVYRGAHHYDGGLTNFIPLPPGLRAGIKVCCFPSKQLSPVYNIQISPDSFEVWPYTLREMLGWAFEPAEEDVLLQFISKGRADAEAWALQSGASAALENEGKAKAGLEQESYPDLKSESSDLKSESSA